MKVTNECLSPLHFADGVALEVGATIDYPEIDLDHAVHSAWLEAGLFTVEEESVEKSLSQMRVDELQKFITDNGGEFGSDDNKGALLKNAQAIEAEIN